MRQIAFGTSGWRGIVAEDFTFENVKVVTQAIADHLGAEGMKGREVIIGHDSRFMGEKFARESARVLAAAGMKALLCRRDTPTPVIAFEILRRGAAGGINFTASHNPAEYNGLKFSPAWGGPALPETTKDIERRANEMLGEICYREMPLDQAVRQGLATEIDPRDEYLQALESKVDFAAIASLGRLAINPLYGTARGYLDTPLVKHKVAFSQVNDYRDPYFGGFPPEPAEKYIQDFIRLVKDDPATKRPLDFPDSASYARYVTGGGRKARDDWRRENVDRFVEAMFKAVRDEKPWVKVGVSPFGIYRPGQPPQIKGFDAYAKLYADSLYRGHYIPGAGRMVYVGLTARF